MCHSRPIQQNQAMCSRLKVLHKRNAVLQLHCKFTGTPLNKQWSARPIRPPWASKRTAFGQPLSIDLSWFTSA